jgi:hypothetical protein
MVRFPLELEKRNFILNLSSAKGFPCNSTLFKRPLKSILEVQHVSHYAVSAMFYVSGHEALNLTRLKTKYIHMCVMGVKRGLSY